MYQREIDNINEELNGLLDIRNFKEVKNILEEVVIHETHPILLRAYLSASKSAELQYEETYKNFYHDAYDVIDIIGDNPDEYLKGLEPLCEKFGDC